MNPDRELETRPVTDAAPARSPDDPPGLDAIRRFFRRRWIQGIWAWLAFIGRGVRAAWRWLAANAGPIARGLEKAGDVAVRTSRGTVAVGRAAVEIGGHLSAWGKERGAAGGARLRHFGDRMRHLGRRATHLGTRAGDVAESVEDLGGELASLSRVDAENRSRPPRSARREPVPAPRPRPAAPLPRTSVLPPAVPDGELPEVFRERIRALGKRRRSKPLRQLIVDICASREWSSAGELAGWLGADVDNLRKRHLRPLLRSGRLRLRHPDNPRHPEQGYGAAG